MAKNIEHYSHSQYHDIKVLFVEVDQFSREKLLRVIKRRFSQVYTAIDSAEGYTLFRNYKPDLIITDIRIDQMSSLEMITKLREHDEKVQIIVTTDQIDNEFFIQSIENSVNHYILKPYELTHFLKAIEKSVNQIRLEKELENQKKLTKAILDDLENLVFVTENEKIIEFNKAFTTFTGICKNQPALNHYQLFFNCFVEEPNYFYPKNKENWAEEFLLNKNPVKVKWKSHKGLVKIFFMRGIPIPDTNQTLFVGTDITDIEAESIKNEVLAYMDPLTKTLNRLKFDELFSSEMSRAERFDHTFSIIMLDIDHFKNVNDRFGHQTGDEVLATISTIVQQRMRENDIFARWGGEEFILLAPKTDGNGALLLAESIRTIICEFQFKSIGSLTCSFGVAEFSKGKPKEQLLNEADQALYQSKNNGRNRSTLYC